MQNWASRVKAFVLHLDSSFSLNFAPARHQFNVDRLISVLHNAFDAHWSTYGDPRSCAEGAGRKKCTYAIWFRGQGVRRPPYLSVPCSFKKLVSCARFRTSCHSLRIETGCHAPSRLPRAQRTCQRCALGVIDDEQHAVFECSKFENLRTEFSELFLHASSELARIWSYPDLHSVVQFFHVLCKQLDGSLS